MVYTSFGVREIRAVSAKRDTSGGSREDWVVVVEHLRTLLFLLWLITTCEKLKLELLLLHLKLKIWFFGAILDTPFSISNALLPIFLEILVQLQWPVVTEREICCLQTQHSCLQIIHLTKWLKGTRIFCCASNNYIYIHILTIQ